MSARGQRTTPLRPQKRHNPDYRLRGGGGCFGLVLLVAFGFIAAGAVGSAKDDPPATVTVTRTDPRVPKLERQNRRWHAYARKLERVNGAQHGMLVASPTVSEAIQLAGATYGYSATLWRKARCESQLRSWVRHSSAKDSPTGLFQFKPSTFASTPYAGFSIVSPYANALAAGWMHVHGRAGEWSCK